jgi:hypothetical protein
MSRFRTWKAPADPSERYKHLSIAHPGVLPVADPGVLHAGSEIRACTVVTIAKSRAAVVTTAWFMY